VRTLIDPKPGLKNGVTIGIPVFNEQDRIERAIRSAAPQCERLIVADNASTDLTEGVCTSLLQEYPSMEYVRHPVNLGSLGNWHYLLDAAKTPYFMTLGSHDFINEAYIENLLKLLQADSSAVLATGNLNYVYQLSKAGQQEVDHEFNCWVGGESANAANRVRSIVFEDARLPWAMYGLFRASVFRKCFTSDLPIIGIDQVFLAKIAREGRILRSRDANYFAFVYGAESIRPSYTERLLGYIKYSTSDKSVAKNEMRRALFGVLKSVCEPISFMRGIFLRFQIMVRYGPYSNGVFDPLFYFFYIPAKLAGEVRRMRRRLRR